MLAAQTGTEYEPLTNWFDAFKRLDGCLSSREKSVLLLDEISWMGKYDPMFTGNLKIAWDNWFSKKPKLIMFLCGSVSSWIDKYILMNTGFVGRPTMRSHYLRSGQPCLSASRRKCWSCIQGRIVTS